MGHRGAKENHGAGTLPPLSLSLLSPSFSLSPSLSLAVSGLPFLLHTSLPEMCVRAKERGGIKCVRACEGACPEQSREAGGLFGAIEIFQHVALAAGTRANKRERVLTGMPIL